MRLMGIVLGSASGEDIFEWRVDDGVVAFGAAPRSIRCRKGRHHVVLRVTRAGVSSDAALDIEVAADSDGDGCRTIGSASTARPADPQDAAGDPDADNSRTGRSLPLSPRPTARDTDGDRYADDIELWAVGIPATRNSLPKRHSTASRTSRAQAAGCRSKPLTWWWLYIGAARSGWCDSHLAMAAPASGRLMPGKLDNYEHVRALENPASNPCADGGGDEGASMRPLPATGVAAHATAVGCGAFWLVRHAHRRRAVAPAVHVRPTSAPQPSPMCVNTPQPFLYTGSCPRDTSRPRLRLILRTWQWRDSGRWRDTAWRMKRRWNGLAAGDARDRLRLAQANRPRPGAATGGRARRALARRRLHRILMLWRVLEDTEA